MSDREVLDGRDRSGGSVEKGTPQHSIKLAEDCLKAGDVDGAVAKFREASLQWAAHWRVASKLTDRAIRDMSDTELDLADSELMGKMPMTTAYFQRAAEAAKSVGKVESWEQALLIAQAARVAWQIAEEVCYRRMRILE